MRSALLAACLLCLATNIKAQWTIVADSAVGTIPVEGGAIHFRDGVLWAGCTNLLRSIDTGATWQTVQLPPALDPTDRITDINFFDRKTGVVVTYFDVYMTNDGGTTWKDLLGGNISSGASGRFVNARDTIAVVGFGPGDVAISTDGGSNWTAHPLRINATSLLTSGTDLYALEAQEAKAAGDGGAIYRSTDAGTTWKQLPGNFDADSYSIAIDSCHQTIYVTNEGYANTYDEVSQIIKSTDGGTTWSTDASGPLRFFAGALSLGTTTIYTSTTKNTVYRSAGDRNWVPIDGPNSQIDSRMLCAVNDSIVFAIDSCGNIWRTMNSGGVPLTNSYIAPHLTSTLPLDGDTVSLCSALRASVTIDPGTGLACRIPEVISEIFTGADSNYFSVIHAPPIGPLSNDSIVFLFHPDAARDFNATFTVALADGRTFPLTLKGRGADSTRITLRADSLVTNTIGEVIMPITISGGVPSSFDFRIVWDSAALEYDGTFDKNGNRIDRSINVEGRYAVVHVTAASTLATDTVIYAHFRFFPDFTTCAGVRFDSGYFWPDTSFCGTIAGVYNIEGKSATICTYQNCAAPYLSRFLQTGTIELRIAPNPATTTIDITASEHLPNASIQILNALGEIEESETSDLGLTPHPLDLSGLPSGVKFVRVAGDGHIHEKSFLLAR